MLGTHLLAADGKTKPDEKGAFRFFKVGCDAEDPDACEQLGLMYKLGKGVRKDAKASKDALQKSCDFGGESDFCQPTEKSPSDPAG